MDRQVERLWDVWDVAKGRQRQEQSLPPKKNPGAVTIISHLPYACLAQRLGSCSCILYIISLFIGGHKQVGPKCKLCEIKDLPKDTSLARCWGGVLTQGHATSLLKSLQWCRFTLQEEVKFFSLPIGFSLARALSNFMCSRHPHVPAVSQTPSLSVP